MSSPFVVASHRCSVALTRMDIGAALVAEGLTIRGPDVVVRPVSMELGPESDLVPQTPPLADAGAIPVVPIPVVVPAPDAVLRTAPSEEVSVDPVVVSSPVTVDVELGPESGLVPQTPPLVDAEAVTVEPIHVVSLSPDAVPQNDLSEEVLVDLVVISCRVSDDMELGSETKLESQSPPLDG